MTGQSFSFTQQRLRDIAQEILDYARTSGASACEADVSEGFGLSVMVRRGAVETIEYNRDKGLGVTVYQGQQRGYASSSDFASEALRATVDAALSIARFTAPDPCSGLPEPELLARDVPDPCAVLPVELAGRGGDRAGAALRVCRIRRQPVDKELGRRQRRNASGAVRRRQQPRIHRRLCHQPPFRLMSR